MVNAFHSVLSESKNNTLRANSFASAIGLANHVAEVFYQGRGKLAPCWDALSASDVYKMWQSGSSENPRIHLSDTAIDSLKWWIRAMHTLPTRALRCPAGPVSDWGPGSAPFDNWRALAAEGALMVIETDAASNGLWGYHITNSTTSRSGPWGDLSCESINYKELWVVLKVLIDFRNFLRGWRVLFRIDNSTAVSYINNRGGKVPALNKLYETIEDHERSALCHIAAAHIKGVCNPVADLSSRVPGWSDSWNIDPFCEATLRRNTFEHIQTQLRVFFTVDAFADQSGHNALTDSWKHPGVTAFEIDFSSEVIWSHPPPLLVFA